MKPQSPFIYAMDGLRPRPARRAVILQRILAARQPAMPPLSLRQWRWALAGVPAVVALVLGLAWSLGAYDADRAAAPDRVTQAAAVERAPEVWAANPDTGKVQWLHNATLASARVGRNLPEKLELLRSEMVELSAGEIQEATAAVEALGWEDVLLQRADEGYYHLTANQTAAAVDKTGDNINEVCEVFRTLASKRGIRVLGNKPQEYAGLRLSTAPDSGSFLVSYNNARYTDSTVDTLEIDMAFWRDEQQGTADILPAEQALKNAFYVQRANPALDPDAGLPVNALGLACVSGVPCYTFPVRTATGIYYGYALAVEQKDLDAIPELAATYRRFLDGEAMQTDIIATPR